MKITLPDGTTVEGTYDELKPWLPPVPQRNWDGAMPITCSTNPDGLDTTVYGGWHLDEHGQIVPNVGSRTKAFVSGTPVTKSDGRP